MKPPVLAFGVVAIITLFATANLPWTLDDYDQAKQAFVSYQMVEQQRWLFQTTPTEGLPASGERHSAFHVSSKPPAVGWLSAGAYLVGRSWDVAWRLPSFLSALALMVLIFCLAKGAYGDFPALIAMVAFGFNMLSPRLATLVRTDMPLALATFAAGAIMFSKLLTREAWRFRDRALLFALLAAGLFIKGPIIYAFILPPVIIHELCRRKWRPDFPSVWSGWWPWIGSFALFVLWVIGGVTLVPGFYHDVVQIEFAGRFGEGIHRPQPLLFYLPHLLQKFAPWSIAIIVLCVLLVRDQRRTGQRLLARVSPDMLWLTTWALGGILAMSLIPSKRVDRIFPAIPPLCLLLAAQLNSLLQNTTVQTRIYRISALLAVLSGVFIGSYTATRVVLGYRQHRDVLDKFGGQVRRLAQREGLRYEVLRAPDEGLLLYLQRPQFFSIQRAEELWRVGAINGLVARRSDLLEIAQWPRMAARPRLETTKRGLPPVTYVFVTRRQGDGSKNNSP